MLELGGIGIRRAVAVHPCVFDRAERAFHFLFGYAFKNEGEKLLRFRAAGGQALQLVNIHERINRLREIRDAASLVDGVRLEKMDHPRARDRRVSSIEATHVVIHRSRIRIELDAVDDDPVLRSQKREIRQRRTDLFTVVELETWFCVPARIFRERAKAFAADEALLDRARLRFVKIAAAGEIAAVRRERIGFKIIFGAPVVIGILGIDLETDPFAHDVARDPRYAFLHNPEILV